MRKFLSVCLMLALLAGLSPTISPARAEGKRVVLMTVYQQQGWGSDAQAGFVDEDGGLWYLAFDNGDGRMPYDTEGRLDFLESADDAQYLGEMDEDAFDDLRSLVACVPDQGCEVTGAANDAGTQMSVAVRYDGDAREIVYLGVSGDSLFENDDPGAQSLYAALRTYFPNVISYAGEKFMSPSGFVPMSLFDFEGCAGAKGASLIAKAMQCEEGPIEAELTDEQEADMLAALSGATVTGKQNSVCVTGGTTVYEMYDAAGEYIADFELYRGLLVRSDGMYAVEWPEK